MPSPIFGSGALYGAPYIMGLAIRGYCAISYERGRVCWQSHRIEGYELLNLCIDGQELRSKGSKWLSPREGETKKFYLRQCMLERLGEKLAEPDLGRHTVEAVCPVISTGY